MQTYIKHDLHKPHENREGGGFVESIHKNNAQNSADSSNIEKQKQLLGMIAKGGGGAPACAACKYQRRRCTPACPLGPYFPANQPKMFRNVHRLFGVSNVIKTLDSLKTKDKRDDAMKSIIYEAEMRERFPVYGCSTVICQLRLQLQYALEELRHVYAQLAVFREQITNQMTLDESMELQKQQSEMISHLFLPDESGDIVGLDPRSNQTQMDSFGIIPDTNMFLYQDFRGRQVGEMIIDDIQSYIDTDALESCSESSLKSEEQNVSQMELKTAATGFSLTTVQY